MSAGGIDTLEISLYGFWHPSTWQATCDRLNAARSKAQSDGSSPATIETPDGDVLTVEPTGCNKGVYCAWVLNWQGCRIAIVNNPAPHDLRISVWVSIGSVRLMDVGHVHAWESVLAVLKSMGYCHCRDVVGRVDLCSDFAEQSMRPIQETIMADLIVCRSRKGGINFNRKSWETYTIGRGPVMLRIYNKTEEVRNDPVKQSLLIEKRWGVPCLEAVRVEFQIRNKALKRYFSITSVSELFERLGTMAEWLTNDWFRMVDSVDRENGNQRRAEANEFWSRVQQSFKSWTGEVLPRVAGQRRLIPDMKQLRQQVVGCVVSVAAHTGQTIWQALKEIAAELRASGEIKLFGKRLALDAGARCGPLIDESEIPF